MSEPSHLTLVPTTPESEAIKRVRVLEECLDKVRHSLAVAELLIFGDREVPCPNNSEPGIGHEMIRSNLKRMEQLL